MVSAVATGMLGALGTSRYYLGDPFRQFGHVWGALLDFRALNKRFDFEVLVLGSGFLADG